MAAYYNEIDPFAAEWLENLILVGAIAPGVVDRRSIEDVLPSDLKGFTQCHFFAGIGVWSHALRAAGWSDDRPVWSGSCPCQPFSAAGQGSGFADERHLWPAMHHLIGECGPDVILGEQVSSKDGLAWLDLVQTDMEASGHAFGAFDLCAAGIGAPHIRQRTYWLAHTNRRMHDRGGQFGPGGRLEYPDGRATRVVDNAHDARLERHAGDDGAARGKEPGRPTTATGVSGGLADADGNRRASRREVRPVCQEHDSEYGNATRIERPGPTNGFWRNADWLACRDHKWRPVEPGTFPLVNGASNRVGALRGYGNAIVAPLAQEFVEGVMAYLDGRP